MPLCHGLPGSMKAVSMFAACAARNYDVSADGQLPRPPHHTGLGLAARAFGFEVRGV